MVSNFSKQIFTFKAKDLTYVHTRTDDRQPSVQWGRKSIGLYKILHFVNQRSFHIMLSWSLNLQIPNSCVGTYTYTYVCIYTYICIWFIFVCVFACIFWGRVLLWSYIGLDGLELAKILVLRLLWWEYRYQNGTVLYFL